MSSAPRRPEHETGLQPERTSLAWERTSVAMVVAGVLLVRYASQHARSWLAVAGLLQTGVGGAALVWANLGHLDRRREVEQGRAVEPVATAAVWLVTTAFVGVALASALWIELAAG